MRIITDRAIQFSGQMITQVTSEINNLLLDSYRVSVMVADEPIIQTALRKPLEADIAQRFSTDLSMDTRLNFIQSSYRDEFFGFYVIGANGGKYKSNFYSVKAADLRDTDWYRKIIHSKEPVWFSTHKGSFAVETVGQLFVSVGFPIVDKASGRISGVVLIDIEEERFSKITGSRLGKTGYMFILDKNNNVVSYPNKSKVSLKIPLDLKTIKDTASFDRNSAVNIDGKNSIVLYKRSPVNGWRIVGVLPVNELTKESRMVGLIIAGLLLVLCLVALGAAWAIAGSVVDPIKKLISLMRKAEEGDLSVYMNVKYNDEVGQLGRSFNLMIGEIGKLMAKVYEEQQELRKAELKALQAQINPHFLYNTLDSIIWLSRAKRDEEVITMATALTKLFRIGISRGRDIISIQEEVEHSDSYLTIQHIRYKNKFSYEIAIPEELTKYQTLKLILQPLIENAIYHGIKMKREPGKIMITAREDEDCLIFEVSDTGIGMTREKLKALENTLKNSSGERLKSYGLKNVNERIKIYFGPEYGLTFFSEYGRGTKVEIKIPKILEVEESVKSSLG
ncbi:MAG: sensor histidine kinase [Bacillota bacterium]